VLDLRAIARDPAPVREALARRGDGSDARLRSVLELDARRRELLPEVEGLRARQNEAGGAIAKAKQAGEDAADAIAALRARDGVFVTTGNHDLHSDDELVALISERGPVVLKNDSRIVRRGSAELVIAGMDAWRASPRDVKRVVADRPPGAPTVLLCHYPTAFEAAAEAGVELLLTGHTHGGQLGIPFLSHRFNFARLTNQRSRGPVYSGKTMMYVNAGLGTTGPPMRLAVPPEIALFTLRRSPPR